MKICIGPYLQTVTRDRVTVVWHTAEPAASRVEYQPCERLGHSAYEQPPPPVYPQKLEDKRPKTVHAFTIEGLDCEWTYFYRVVAVFADGAVEKSAGAMFRTAPALGSPFRFVTYGDCLREPEAHHRNAELARGLRPDFCLATGDMAQDVIETFPHRFFSPAAGLLRYSPWYTTMGNHDSPNEGFFRYFRFPTPHYWYSFNYGCAHFTVLNTCMDYRPGSEQWHWLEHDLQRFHAARWKFVVFHHPPYCSSDCEIARTRILDRLFDQYRVDFVLTAHATRYERSHPLSGGRYDSAGTVYLVTGGGGYDMSLPCSFQRYPPAPEKHGSIKSPYNR